VAWGGVPGEILLDVSAGGSSGERVGVPGRVLALPLLGLHVEVVGGLRPIFERDDAARTVIAHRGRLGAMGPLRHSEVELSRWVAVTKT
jgi:hypothetical protein